MNQEKMGKFIYKMRTEKNLSQYQLAELIPISRQAVSKWERGETIPDSSTLLKLSELFDVTINELLIGEKKDNITIEELETTTLNIIDESNRKTKKIIRNFKISVFIIVTLLLTFLSYYFINSYNSIKIYKISGENKNTIIKDGIFVQANNKVYIKIGNIKNNSDLEISKISIYYLDTNNKKQLINENKDTEKLTIIDYGGYSEKMSLINLNKIISNSYIEITYTNNKKEIIKLKFQKDYINENLFFYKKTHHNNLKKIKSVSAYLPVEEKTVQEIIKKDGPSEILQKEKSVIQITEHKEDLFSPVIEEKVIINQEENNNVSENVSKLNCETNALENDEENIADENKTTEENKIFDTVNSDIVDVEKSEIFNKDNLNIPVTNIEESDDIEEKTNTINEEELDKNIDNSNINNTANSEEFTIDIIINNLKEKSLYFEGSYIYEIPEENILFLYYENLKQISTYVNDEFEWDYYIDENRYNCAKNTDKSCKETIVEMLKNNLIKGGN